MATYCCVATGDVHHQLLEDCPTIVVALEDKGEELPHEWEGGDVTEEGGEVEGGEQHGLRSLLGRRRVGMEGRKKGVGGALVHKEQYILEHTYVHVHVHITLQHVSVQLYTLILGHYCPIWALCTHVKVIHIYIPRCHGNCGKLYHIYKLKEGSSRLDSDITEIKKPLIISGAHKSCYITSEYGRCEDSNLGVNKLALLQT